MHTVEEFSASVCTVEILASKFDVSVTMHHWYSIINSQLDATITNFIDNYNQLSMFWVIISPILRSTKLWYNALAMLPAGTDIHTTGKDTIM